MDEHERTRSMGSFIGMLKAYLVHSESEECSRHLPLQGQILGRMVPRCSDPKLYIRQTAIDCIQITLCIATCMPGKQGTIGKQTQQMCVFRYPRSVGGCFKFAA